MTQPRSKSELTNQASWRIAVNHTYFTKHNVFSFVHIIMECKVLVFICIKNKHLNPFSHLALIPNSLCAFFSALFDKKITYI